jgi:hypothetical protein
MALVEIEADLFARLARGTIDSKGARMPIETLLCGLTDSFEAQARVNRLALQLGLPRLFAQVYWEGRGAEITFTHPDVTPACHRCMLSGRYEYYLDKGFKNGVTSDGTPIFATTRLNALKGFVAMALLHWGTVPEASVGARRWAGVLRRIEKRNLIQIRMDPDIASTLNLDVFDMAFVRADSERIVFDDVVWLPQRSDSPESNGRQACPDCGGTGSLRDAIGYFENTLVAV